MLPDPIVEQVRRVRKEYAEQFGYDIHALAADLQRRERQHAERLVTYSPKSPRVPSPPHAAPVPSGH